MADPAALRPPSPCPTLPFLNTLELQLLHGCDLHFGDAQACQRVRPTWGDVVTHAHRSLRCLTRAVPGMRWDGFWGGEGGGWDEPNLHFSPAVRAGHRQTNYTVLWTRQTDRQTAPQVWSKELWALKTKWRQHCCPLLPGAGTELISLGQVSSSSRTQHFMSGPSASCL